MPSTQLEIRVRDLPPFKELYESVHSMLIARLLHGQGSREFFEAINRVIDAHDAIAESTEEDECSPF